MRAIAARVRLAVVTWPSVRAGLELSIATTIVAVAGAAIGIPSGLLHFAPRGPIEIARVAAIAFLAPALSEELIFRGALIPGRDEAKHGFAWIVVSTVLFTLWHVIENRLSPGRKRFLPSHRLLGAGCVAGFALRAIALALRLDLAGGFSALARRRRLDWLAWRAKFDGVAVSLDKLR